MSDCPKCHTQGKTQKMEQHHCSMHRHCPTHGWMAESDLREYWDAIEEYRQKARGGSHGEKQVAGVKRTR